MFEVVNLVIVKFAIQTDWMIITVCGWKVILVPIQ